MTSSNTSSTHEVVTGLPNMRTMTGVVIYEVKNGKITRVWLML